MLWNALLLLMDLTNTFIMSVDYNATSNYEGKVYGSV